MGAGGECERVPGCGNMQCAGTRWNKDTCVVPCISRAAVTKKESF